MGMERAEIYNWVSGLERIDGRELLHENADNFEKAETMRGIVSTRAALTLIVMLSALAVSEVGCGDVEENEYNFDNHSEQNNINTLEFELSRDGDPGFDVPSCAVSYSGIMECEIELDQKTDNPYPVEIFMRWIDAEGNVLEQSQATINPPSESVVVQIPEGGKSLELSDQAGTVYVELENEGFKPFSEDI